MPFVFSSIFAIIKKNLPTHKRKWVTKSNEFQWACATQWKVFARCSIRKVGEKRFDQLLSRTKVNRTVKETSGFRFVRIYIWQHLQSQSPPVTKSQLTGDLQFKDRPLFVWAVTMFVSSGYPIDLNALMSSVVSLLFMNQKGYPGVSCARLCGHQSSSIHYHAYS